MPRMMMQIWGDLLICKISILLFPHHVVLVYPSYNFLKLYNVDVSYNITWYIYNTFIKTI